MGAVAAVKKVYSEMEVSFTKNVTVVYDGTWLTRSHSSHVGVGCITEFHTGLVLDSVVLSNFCIGCSLGPAECNPTYLQWRQQHQCQKNTDVGSGRMEVEAALQLSGRSLAKNDLRYTAVVSDGHSHVFQALRDEQPYGFIAVTIEDCINHVKKKKKKEWALVLAPLSARPRKGNHWVAKVGSHNS